MCSSLQAKLRGGGRRESGRQAGRQGGREQEPPCLGRRVISGETSLWACGHGLRGKREELEEETVDTQQDRRRSQKASQ